MKRTVLILAALTLGACAPNVPDSNPEGRSGGQGVVFGDYRDYNDYRRTRDSELKSGDRTATPPPAGAAAPAPDSGPALDSTARISDEQNFNAVSERETIESDAARLYAQASAYEQVKPTAVPTRNGDSGTNVVAFALQTSHPVGTEMYKRVGLFTASKHERNCARYATPDLAQEDFLKNGGPERDKLALDPDGDGYACKWDPAQFRSIAG